MGSSVKNLSTFVYPELKLLGGCDENAREIWGLLSDFPRVYPGRLCQSVRSSYSIWRLLRLRLSMSPPGSLFPLVGAMEEWRDTSCGHEEAMVGCGGHRYQCG